MRMFRKNLAAKRLRLRNRQFDCMLLMFLIVNFIMLLFILILTPIPSTEVFVCPSNAVECIYD